MTHISTEELRCIKYLKIDTFWVKVVQSVEPVIDTQEVLGSISDAIIAIYFEIYSLSDLGMPGPGLFIQ